MFLSVLCRVLGPRNGNQPVSVAHGLPILLTPDSHPYPPIHSTHHGSTSTFLRLQSARGPSAGSIRFSIPSFRFTRFQNGTHAGPSARGTCRDVKEKRKKKERGPSPSFFSTTLILVPKILAAHPFPASGGNLNTVLPVLPRVHARPRRRRAPFFSRTVLSCPSPAAASPHTKCGFRGALHVCYLAFPLAACLPIKKGKKTKRTMPIPDGADEKAERRNQKA